MNLEWSEAHTSRLRVYCRYCESLSQQQPILTVNKGPERDRWCKCVCGTLNTLDLRNAPDYSVVEDETSFFMRLDQADSADGVIGPATRFSPTAAMPFVDVGCGLGFAADYMRWTGIDSLGIDPSRASWLAAEALGMPVANSPSVTDLSHDPRDRFVLLSEVIEHVESPRALLASLFEVVGPSGMLLVTTPDADSINRSAKEAHVLAAIGSGQHLFLLGEAQLRQALADTGFVVSETWTDAGRLFAVASRSRIPASGEFDGVAYRSYLQARLEDRFKPDQGQPDLVARAFGARLFKDLVHGGEYQAAESVFEVLSSVFRRLDLDLSEPRVLAQRYGEVVDDHLNIPNPRLAPMSAPMLCYLRAIQLAHRESPMSDVAAYLDASVRLAALYANGLPWQVVDLEIASLSNVVAKTRSDLGLGV